MNDSFQDKIRSHLASMRDTPQPDWEERKRWWIAQVERLYIETNTWMAPILSNEETQIRTQQVMLHEDRLGDYMIPIQSIHLGEEVLTLHPKGTLVVGASGRIDVSGPNGKAMLLLIKRDDDPTGDAYWAIAHAGNKAALSQLDRSSFEQLVLDLMGIGD